MLFIQELLAHVSMGLGVDFTPEKSIFGIQPLSGVLELQMLIYT
jgi:hypothetical protein